MKNKSLVALTILLFIVSFVSFGFAGDEITGQIIKIDGKTVTIKESDGKTVQAEVTSEVELKKGDMVTIKDGIAVKAAKKKIIEGC